MNWPNKITLLEPTKPFSERFSFIMKIDDLDKWCCDNISSRGVLWKLECENKPRDGVWNFYFAQAEDATVFKLTHNI